MSRNEHSVYISNHRQTLRYCNVKCEICIPIRLSSLLDKKSLVQIIYVKIYCNYTCTVKVFYINQSLHLLVGLFLILEAYLHMFK